MPFYGEPADAEVGRGACAAAEGTYNFAMGLYDGSCSDFSESFIMWCLGRLPQYSSHFFGCGGADWDYAELDALTAEGVCSEGDFPYTETDPGSCTHWGDLPPWHSAIPFARESNRVLSTSAT